jgi:cell division protein FtsQ
LKKWLNIALKSIFGLAILVVLGFASSSQNNQRVSDFVVEVDYSSNLFFVQQEKIKTDIIYQADSLFGIKVKNVNLIDIEEKLLENPFIEKARVYSTINGILKAEVSQKRPIARVVFTNGSSKYLDDKGNFFPTSNHYAARTLIFSGYIKPVNQSVDNDSLNIKKLKKDINILSGVITRNPFWKAQITQVYVKPNGEFELIPRVGGHIIEIGSTRNIEKKLKKLEIFYREGLPKTDWNAYKTINIKYKDQIVCTKK